MVIRRWKQHVMFLGINIGAEENLTNIRYADDLMIYATSLKDLDFMLESLVAELARCGLHVNSKKCKILSLNPTNHARYLDIAGEFIEIMKSQDKHLYLGRMLTGDPLRRSEAEFSHRCQCAWMKFHQHKDALTDKIISVKSRLKLFHSIISPTVLFGLAQIP